MLHFQENIKEKTTGENELQSIVMLNESYFFLRKTFFFKGLNSPTFPCFLEKFCLNLKKVINQVPLQLSPFMYKLLNGNGVYRYKLKQ